MITLLQGVTTQFGGLFLDISYCRVQQSILLRSVIGFYHKVRQALQSVTVITK